jgi:hypothetical protein
MKVLVQAWNTEYGYLFSVSKSPKQLNKTIARLKRRYAEPYNEPGEIEIPDDHVLARVIENETFFVLGDENEDGATAYLH